MAVTTSARLCMFKDGKTLLTVTASSKEELKAWILSFGPKAKMLSPTTGHSESHQYAEVPRSGVFHSSDLLVDYGSEQRSSLQRSPSYMYISLREFPGNRVSDFLSGFFAT